MKILQPRAHLLISTTSPNKEMSGQAQKPKPECSKCRSFIHDHLETSFHLRFPLTNRKDRLHAISPRPALSFLATELNRAINPAKFSIYEYKVFVENLDMILRFCGYNDLLNRFYSARPDLMTLFDAVIPPLIEAGLAKIEPLRLWLRDEILMLVQELYDVHLPHSELKMPNNDLKSPRIFTSQVPAQEEGAGPAPSAPMSEEFCIDDELIDVDDELYR